MNSVLVLVLLFAVAVVLAALLLYRRPKPREHVEEIGLPEVRRLLATLLERGYDLGFLVFELPGEERFVEFSKYIREGDRRGLTLDFPLAPWSEPYYEQVKGLLESRGISYVVEDTPNGPVKEFIQADFQQDLDTAAAVGRDIFIRVFRVDPSTRLTADLEQVAPARG